MNVLSQKGRRKVVVTGGAGRIGRFLCDWLQQGAIGPVDLVLLERESNLEELEGFKGTSDPFEAFAGADLILFAGAIKGKQGAEEILFQNVEAFQKQAAAIQAVCKKPPLLLVIANPCNLLAWVLWKSLPHFPPDRFHALVQLDHNRAAFLLAKKLGVEQVDHVAVWGNHSSTIVPGWEGELDRDWALHEWMPMVQQRGELVTALCGQSSGGSAARAALQAVQNLWAPTQPGKYYSTALPALGNPYGITPDLVFSFPCRTTEDGSIVIVPHLAPIDWEAVKISERELLREIAFNHLV